MVEKPSTLLIKRRRNNLPTITEICSKCNFCKLWAKGIKNSMGGIDFYNVECPKYDCGYTGHRDWIVRDTSLDMKN